MARDPKVTRKAYEYKLGKDLVSKLDDKQIHLLSQYYNSLSDKETSEIDSQIVQGRNNTELHEMAIGMVEENESKKTPPKPKAKPKPKVAPKPKAKAKPKKAYDEDRSVAYKLPDHILKDLDEDQIKDLSAVYNMMSADEKKEFGKGTGDLMDLARQMSDPLQEKYNTGGLDSWTGKPKDNSNAKQGPMPMPSAKKKPDKKAVTAIVKKFSTEKKEDTKQPANETIDPEVLELLGIEDYEAEMDYEQFRTLLKEFLSINQEGSLIKGGKEFSADQLTKVRDTYKKSKGKNGRFKPKKKSVNISKVVQSGRKYNKSAVNTQKLLSGSKEAESTKVKVKGEAVTDSFENINQTLVGIDSLLKNILGEEKKESEQEEKTARKAAQKAEEEKSEKNAKTKATKALKGFKAPKMGFLDMIKRFFKNILLGGFIMKALDWFQKEENQEKIQNVITFITDHMDKILLGIAALVGLNIGMKILGFLKLFSPLVSGLSFVLKGLLGLLMGPTGLIGVIAGGLAALLAIEAVAPSRQPGLADTSGKFAQWNNPKIGPESRKLVIEGTFGHLDPRQWDPDALDYYKQLHEELNIPLPDKFKNAESEMEPSMKGHERVYGSGAGRARDLSTNDKIIADIRRILNIERQGWSTGDLTKSPIEGVGTHMQGRNLLGMGKHKYFDVNGKEISREEFERLAIAKMEGLGAYSNTGENQQKVTPQTPMIAPTGAYDVIIPLDHAKKAGTVADDASGKTFEQSKSTGADGREREHQDSAAAKLKLKLEEKGLKVKIVTPEEYGNYADYDKFIKGQANKGVRIVPLHFDAIRSAGGVGFLTRTRAGDDQDAAFAAPITDALAKFQKENPELGNMKSDTKGNATVKAGAASPTALVELGVMTDWEDKYGKNFTGTSKFDELIQGVADGIFTGGGFTAPPGMQEVKPGHSRPEPPAPPNTDPAPVVLPLSGGGSGDNELSSASGGRASAASFSSIDGNNPNPTQVGAIFNLTAVG